MNETMRNQILSTLFVSSCLQHISVKDQRFDCLIRLDKQIILLKIYFFKKGHKLQLKSEISIVFVF